MRSRRLIYIGFTVLVLMLVGILVARQVNSNSIRFFETGRSISKALEALALQLKSSNREGVAAAFAGSFSGKPLGLAQLATMREKDGIQEFRFVSGTTPQTKESAVAELADYIATFGKIEEVYLFIHRVEQWDDPAEWIVTARFEVLGSPAGAESLTVDRGMLRLHFEAGANPKISSLELLHGGRLVSQKPHFVNVAEAAGIAFENRYYPSFLNQKLRFAMIIYGPGGITTADYDNDGLYDLFIPDGVESRMYRNLGTGSFEDVTKSSGLSGLDGVSVGTFADYDNDGDKDFFVSRTFNPNQLFRNNGNGTFTDVTAQSGIGADCCTTVASWADYNNDGNLDLYVGRYLDPRLDIPTTFYARNGEPNQLYKNNGDGTFTNVTVEAGVGELGLCLGTVFGDYNDDGWPDLYVVNDFGRNTLYRNNGDGTFTDVSVEANTLSYGAGMNATIGDYNNDGRLDIYVTNIRSEHAWFAEAPTIHRYMYNSFAQGVWLTDMPLYLEMFRQSGFDFIGIFQQMASGNTLLKNKGDGTFEDVTWEADANPPGWFWGAGMFDYDNDGWQDIYAANGWVYNDPGTEIELDFLNGVVSQQDVYKTGLFFDPDHFGQISWHGWERNRMLRNNTDGTFTEIGRPSGSDLIMNSRGVAVADYWNRGVMDIAVAASTDVHALLKNEVGQGRNWLQVELVGTQSNRDAVGARATIRIGDKAQTREVILGDGYGSQNTLRLHYGIGDATTVDELTVRWPVSNQTQTFRNLSSNQIVEVTEGNETLRQKKYEVVSQ